MLILCLKVAPDIVSRRLRPLAEEMPVRHSTLRVAVLNWRDSTHPEGGGSERYVERIAADLVADGCDVLFLCARHPAAPRRAVRAGVQFHHAGGRFSVYPRALLSLLLLRLRGRAPDVVIDVHNGIPFFARLVAGRPVVVLLHHVHREQWGVVFGRMRAGIGWWLESRVSPRIHAGCQYVTVSEVTRRELVELGVRADTIAVVHNGTARAPASPAVRDDAPALVVLGRLVPHKRVEHALHVVAALRDEFPSLRLRVIGDGWWRAQLEAEARRLGVTDRVVFTGFVDEGTKARLLAQSWLLLAPSVKEGWGVMVMEAGAQGVPALAYRAAGGLAESIVDGRTGTLVDDLPHLIEATRSMLLDSAYRESLGRAAREYGEQFSWRTASTSMHLLVRSAAAGLPPTSAVDPTAGGQAVDQRSPYRTS